MKNLIGEPVLRVEDERLLQGKGQFTDDLNFDGQLYAHFIRSPHAHARIVSIDASVAVRMPGVQAFANGETLAKVGFRPIDPLSRSEDCPVTNKDGSQPSDVRRWLLARNKVRFVGEPVAVIVAGSISQAQAAADSVEIEYEPLQPLINVDDAMQKNAPLVWDELENNVCVDTENGDAKAVDLAFRSAARVASYQVEFPRHIVAYMEPRSVLARYDTDKERFEIYCGTQSPHWHKQEIAYCMNVPTEQVRIVSLDTGGGFGARARPYPEYAVVGWLAQFTGHPVKWLADRSECFATDTQSRDQRMDIKLAIDEDGKMTAVRLSSVWRLGAYLSPRSVWLHASYMYLMVCGVYRIPAVHYELKGVFTNTAPIAAFRGVARAETSYALERVVDEAARELGINRLSFRRRNLIRESDMPWATPTGANYSAGDYPASFRKLLKCIDMNEYSERHQNSRAAGKLRGLGYSVFVDSVGGSPNEFAEVEVDGEFVEARVGTKSIGTGHETVFAQFLASKLQVPFEKIRIIDGDTDLVRTGSGTHASRSLRVGGTAIFHSAERMLEKGREHASECLEVALQDIEYASGRFIVSGTDRRIGLFDVAKSMRDRGKSLVASHEHITQDHAFSSGCQACEVEIDPETGQLTVERVIAVSDPGKVVNPVIAEGQVHGGIAQGLGHAVCEKAEYDQESGQLTTGSYLDYTLPRADNLPFFETIWSPVETDENPLGVKGVGEIGTMGAPAAMMNAIEDALKPFGITGVQMPVTSERLWKLIRDAKDQ